MKNGGSTKKDNWLRRRNPIERIFHDREQESSSSAVIVIFFFFFFLGQGIGYEVAALMGTIHNTGTCGPREAVGDEWDPSGFVSYHFLFPANTPQARQSANLFFRYFQYTSFFFLRHHVSAVSFFLDSSLSPAF